MFLALSGTLMRAAPILTKSVSLPTKRPATTLVVSNVEKHLLIAQMIADLSRSYNHKKKKIHYPSLTYFISKSRTHDEVQLKRLSLL
jgi:hypothetical protein